MIKTSLILTALLVVFTTSKASAQKKNSFSFQTGLLNYFYDEDPILMNTSALKYVKGIRDFTISVLIDSYSFNYTRNITNKSSISIIGGRFRGYYIKYQSPKYSLQIKRPVVDQKEWYFTSVEYNRKVIDKNKFQLFVGGGLTYRHGFVVYHVFSYPAFIFVGEVGYESVIEFIPKRNLGLVLNTNLKYNFWKNFFFSSKIDLQYYFHETNRTKKEFIDLTEIYSTRKFTPAKKLNHTLTLGIGIDF